MKVWEETWTAEYDPAFVGARVMHDGTEVLYSSAPDDEPYHPARVKLAAQAPAMARLLLKLEWIDVDRGEGCPSCGMFRGSGHAADCEIVEVLRAAGVTS